MFKIFILGVDPKDFENIDGISMWDTLLQGSEQSLRTEYPYNIDPADKNNSVGAVRVGDWKYYKGLVNTFLVYTSIIGIF